MKLDKLKKKQNEIANLIPVTISIGKRNVSPFDRLQDSEILNRQRIVNVTSISNPFGAKDPEVSEDV
jgi:hypothetical protein